MADSDGFCLVWRNDVPALLVDRHGEPVATAELLEWSGGDVADGSVAVGLQFADGWLTIYNALDENGIAFGEIAPEYRLWCRL